MRMKTFLEREAEIAKHNEKFARGEESYSRGANLYSDMAAGEFGKFAFGVKLEENKTLPMAPSIKRGPLPPAFDWREKGAVTSVKAQLNCGSCYAFAGTALLESFLITKRNLTMDISEQDAVDCSIGKYPVNTPDGPMKANLGCDGGWPSLVLKFYVENGLVEEKNYKYTSGTTRVHGQCRRPTPTVRLTGVVVKHEMVNSEAHMAQLLCTKGPLYVSIAAGDDKLGQTQFMELRQGIFDNNGAATNWQVNHGVVVVGYGSENGKDFWVVKNSWGTWWGENGFGRIRRGRNMCRLLDQGVVYVE